MWNASMSWWRCGPSGPSGPVVSVNEWYVTIKPLVVSGVHLVQSLLVLGVLIF